MLHKKISTAEGTISSQFAKLGLSTYIEAARWIQNLPYRHNSDKDDLLIVLKECCGTCSTKHAILKRLADENDIYHIKLILGVFRMNAINTPAIKDILAQKNLSYLPEAHNYLKLANTILDYTGLPVTEEIFSDVLLTEIEISAEQINTFKINFHKEYVQKWIKENNIAYSLEEIWKIREKCILALIKANLSLHTQRLYMRPFEEKDAEALFLLNDDPDVLQYTGDVQFENIESAQNFIAHYDQYELYSVGRLTVILKSTNEVLGWCGLKYHPEKEEYDIGYRFFKTHWGKGYATESAFACFKYAFEILCIKSIIGRSCIENKASIHVFEKLHMKFEKEFIENGKKWVLYRLDK